MWRAPARGLLPIARSTTIVAGSLSGALTAASCSFSDTSVKPSTSR